MIVSKLCGNCRNYGKFTKRLVPVNHDEGFDYRPACAVSGRSEPVGNDLACDCWRPGLSYWGEWVLFFVVCFIVCFGFPLLLLVL